MIREPRKAKPQRIATYRADMIETAQTILNQNGYDGADAWVRWARAIMAGATALSDQWKATA